MRTQQYLDAQQNQINQTLSQIENLQKQLDELRQQVRVNQQLHKAQETAQHELEKWLNQGKKLLRDCSSVFPQSYLDDVIAEVEDITSEIKTNYQEYSECDRFLNSATQEQQDKAEPEKDYQDFEILAEVKEIENDQIVDTDNVVNLPSEDDDTTPLNSNQVLSIIKPLKEGSIANLRLFMGISGKIKKLESLAKAIADKGISHKKLLQLIDIGSTEGLILNGNGKS